jgi:WD40 repeat protein
MFSRRAPLLGAACLAATLFAAPADPPADKAATDLNGDPLPDGAQARLGTTRWRAGALVSCLAVSPDGATVASAGSGGAIRLWEAETGKQLHALWGHRGFVGAVAFSPDGKTLVSGGEDKTVRIWDVASGKEWACFTGHEGLVSRAAFTPDGKAVISSGEDGMVRRWDVETGKESAQCRLPGKSQQVRALTADGGRAALAGPQEAFIPNALRLWDLAEGKEIRALGKDLGYTIAACFSPDGKLLATCEPAGGKVRLWNTANGDESLVIDVSTYGRPLGFSPDGKALATEEEEGVVRLRDAFTGKEIRALECEGGVRALAFAPDGKTVFTVGGDMVIRRWDASTGKQLVTGDGPQGFLSAVAFSPDGKYVLSGGFDPFVRLWDAATGKEVRAFRAARRQFTLCVAFSADGKTAAAGSSGGGLFVWDVESGRRVSIATVRNGGGENQDVVGLAFSPDGETLYTSGYDKLIRRWDVQTGREKDPLTGHEKNVFSLTLSPDGKTLVSTSGDHTLRLWDAKDGKELRRLNGPDANLVTAVLSPDGRTIAGTGVDRIIRLWDVEGGQEIRQWKCPYGRTLCFSPDGKYLASDSGQAARVWEAATGREVCALVGHRSPLWRVAFSLDGKRLATTGDDATVLVWDVERFLGKGPPQRLPLGGAELAARWEQLGDAVPGVPDYAAVVLRAAGPQMVALARERLLSPPKGGGEMEVRALEVLERIGTLEARRVLESVADGPADAPLTREAKACLERLDKPPAPKP